MMEERLERFVLSVHFVEVLFAGPIIVKNKFSLPAVRRDMSRFFTMETNWSVVCCSPNISLSGLRLQSLNRDFGLSCDGELW